MRKLFVFIVTAFVALFLPLAVSANTQGDYIQQTAQISQKYLHAIGSHVYFDAQRARAEGASQDVIDFGFAVEQMSQAYNVPDGGIAVRAAIGIKIYGNYCGPGHNGNDFKLPPIDVLDAGCREHDRCFKGMGYRKNCKCNKNLIDYIDRNYNRMSKGAKWRSQVIKAYFSTAGQLGC